MVKTAPPRAAASGGTAGTDAAGRSRRRCSLHRGGAPCVVQQQVANTGGGSAWRQRLTSTALRDKTRVETQPVKLRQSDARKRSAV